MLKDLLRIFTVTLLTLFPYLLFATEEPPKTQARNKDWNVSVGAALLHSPAFLGSKDSALSLFPDLRVGYEDKFFASVPEGIGYKFQVLENFKIGPLAKIRCSRSEENGGSPFQISGGTSALRGMGEVDSAVESGLFGEYQLQKLKFRTEVRRGFGGHQGSLMDLNLSYNNRLGPLSYGFGPKMTYATSSFINTYYGINSEQSRKAGLGQYRASSGIASYGFGYQLRMPVSSNVMLTNFASYDYLGDALKKSPLIQERGKYSQFSFGLAIGYRLNFLKK